MTLSIIAVHALLLATQRNDRVQCVKVSLSDGSGWATQGHSAGSVPDVEIVVPVSLVGYDETLDWLERAVFAAVPDADEAGWRAALSGGGCE